MNELSAPYAGGIGHSGSETSKARDDYLVASGKALTVQQTVLQILESRGQFGLTNRELRKMVADPEDHHHGTTSGTLSDLHKDEKIARLKEKRVNNRIYVRPEYVAGRETDAQGGKNALVMKRLRAVVRQYTTKGHEFEHEPSNCPGCLAYRILHG